MAWLDLGGKNLLLSGNHLASDLVNSGSEGARFLMDYMGLDLASSNLKEEIQNQSSPTVLVAEAGTGIFSAIRRWAYNITAKYTQGLDAVVPIRGLRAARRVRRSQRRRRGLPLRRRGDEHPAQRQPRDHHSLRSDVHQPQSLQGRPGVFADH